VANSESSKNTYMVISKRNSEKVLPIVFYVFISALIINLLFFCSWSYYGPFVLFGFICYPIEIFVVIFSIAYYFITRKKVYGFWIILTTSIPFLITLIWVILFVLGWNHGDPAKRIN